jgi:hypothetical protein
MGAKKIISCTLTLLFVFIVILSLNINANSKELPVFNDVGEKYWAKEAITYMVQNDIIKGYPGNDFKPYNNISREEFATIMVKSLNLEKKTEVSQTFEDVPQDSWSFNYVESAKQYLTGYELNNISYYKPKEKAVREDMAVALINALGFDANNYIPSNLDVYSDMSEISISLMNYVGLAIEKKIMNGYPPGESGLREFKPKGELTRAEACMLIFNALKVKGIIKTVTDTVNTSVINDDDSDSQYKEILVSSKGEFIDSLGSNRKLMLKEGTYNFASLINIRNIDNLTIEPEKANTQIKINGASSMNGIIKIDDCSNITMKNLTISFDEESAATYDGVLVVNNSKNINLKECYLNGSKTLGLVLNECLYFNFIKSGVYNCSSVIMEINNSNRVKFGESKFYDNGGMSGDSKGLIKFVDSSEIVFEGCKFYDNFDNTYLFYASDSSSYIPNPNTNPDDISSQYVIKKSSIYNNLTRDFSNNTDAITTDSCTFENNSFDKTEPKLEEVLVSDATQLLANISSNKIIRLAPGIYDFSNCKFPEEQKGAYFSKNGLIFNVVSNLKLIGPTEGETRFTSNATINKLFKFTFNNSKNITLENIEFGQTLEEAQYKWWVTFNESKEIVMNDCHVLGKFSVLYTDGFSCSNSTFKNGEEYSGIFTGIKNATFKNVEFSDTITNHDFILKVSNCNVLFDTCVFQNNKKGRNNSKDVYLFSVAGNVPVLRDCKILNNKNMEVVKNKKSNDDPIDFINTTVDGQVWN